MIMKFHKIILLFHLITLTFFINNFVNARTSNILRITLPNNSKLIGRYFTSTNGYGYRGFLGIPYAEPPIGNLRFRSPVPAAPWLNERIAHEDGSHCMQWNAFLRLTKVHGSDDCLYLNVHTPLNITNLLPVMVFIHGGGFMAGSGNKLFFDPDHLMDNMGIIYVGINYRLGPLGFLSTGQEDCPGNFGLKDQVMALQWIKENIHVFGGDPNQVTIFGESAGGASVAYLMMSPLSKGLFQKAISQSGTNLNPWSEPINGNSAQKRAIQIGAYLNCTVINSNWKDFVDCLRSKSASDITNLFSKFYDWDFDPMVAFPPVIEENRPESYIVNHPRDVTDVHGDSIPWIVGVNLDEGSMKSAHIASIPKLYDDVKTNWNKILPIILYYNQYPNDVKQQITNRINRYYFGDDNRKYSIERNQNLTNIISDGWFMAGIDEYIRKRFQNSKAVLNDSKTYVYLFAHKGEASFTEVFNGDPETYFGVCHADELQYLFAVNKRWFLNAVPSENDIMIRKTFIELWTNFAKYGNPTPSDSKLPNWTSANEYPLKYLRIGNANDESKPIISMESGLFEERCQFWNNLFEDLSIRNVKGEL